MQTNLKPNRPSRSLEAINEPRLAAVDPLQIGERVQQILLQRGISTTQLQELTRRQYGEGSPFDIPNSFLSRLKRGLSPHLCQVLALSRFTDYRLSEWLRVFGFDLQDIPRLQLKLHAKRTTAVMPSESLESDGEMAIEHPSRQEPAASERNSHFLYSKIGHWDGMAFPDIMPGSIVRVDTTRKEIPGPGSRRNLLLVEHLRGLSCCHVTRLAHDDVLLTPNYLPYPCLRYRLGEQAVILGTVDAELRPLRDVPIPAPVHSSWIERRYPVSGVNQPATPARLIRASRDRLGLRYREAHAITQEIAAELGNDKYAVALGSLSDYEASDTLPRHIPKIISLCITYAMDFLHYLKAAGVELQNQGARSMPQYSNWRAWANFPFLPNSPISAPSDMSCPIPPSLVRAFMQCMYQEGSLGSIEYFSDPEGHSGLTAGFLVDRNSTRFERAVWPAAWQRPIYLVRHRNGHYLHGFCTITDGMLTVHQSPAKVSLVNSYPSADVEVVGQVVAVLRKLARN